MENINENFSIPLPSFVFATYVEQAAKAFCKNKFRDPWGNVRNAKQYVDSELFNFFNREHRIQFLGHLINYAIDSFEEHHQNCNLPYCQAEKNTTEILYYLYGKLSECGIEVDQDLFSQEELNNNKLLLKTIDDKLVIVAFDYSKGVHDYAILKEIENIRNDIKALKQVEPFGKKRFFQSLKGVIAEYASNKALDFVFKAILPELHTCYQHVKPLFSFLP